MTPLVFFDALANGAKSAISVGAACGVAGIYIAVHLEARKLGLKGVPKEELPKLRQLLPKVYLLLPLIVLVWLVATNKHTMQFSAAVAIGITILVGLYNNLVTIATKSQDKSDNLNFPMFIDALEAGAKSTITVSVSRQRRLARLVTSAVVPSRE